METSGLHYISTAFQLCRYFCLTTENLLTPVRT